MRIYDLKPGKLQEYMSAMREVAVPLRREYGVPLAAWFYTEIGSINRIYHIWAYKDLEHYEQKKQEVYTDPRWYPQGTALDRCSVRSDGEICGLLEWLFRRYCV